MRLLDSRTLQLREFADYELPPYAILSHTWGKEEVSFQEMNAGQCSSKEGFSKIKRCSLRAQLDGFEYVWIDTCCIDKSSSAELTEAINSMYRWYRDSQVCYAYLGDVPLSADARETDILFARSRWFTRGWTLQELIAPKHVVFYGRNWVQIGMKANLGIRISQITDIDEPVLKGGNLESVSVAKRMSWASKRVTTKIEDLAYCLLGIFGVNMPMFYGEGEKAFIRLQEEIMKDSDDQSLFAWGTISNITYSGQYRSTLPGVLARSPAEFANAGAIVPFRKWDASEPYSMTNKGLRAKLPLVFHGGTRVAVLDCQVKDDFGGPIGIRLHSLTDRGDQDPEGDQFARLEAMPCVVPLNTVSKAVSRTVFIRKEVLHPNGDELTPRHGFLIQRFPATFTLSEVYPSDMWNPNQRIVRLKWPNAGNRWCAALLFEALGRPGSFIVLLGYDENGERGRCSILGPKLDESLEQVLRRACMDTKYREVSKLSLEPMLHAAVRVEKETVMGQKMFVVDIDICGKAQVDSKRRRLTTTLGVLLDIAVDVTNRQT